MRVRVNVGVLIWNVRACVRVCVCVRACECCSLNLFVLDHPALEKEPQA